MQRIVKTMPDSCSIIAGSCTHVGSVMCYKEGIDRTVDEVASTPNMFFLHLGDWCEAIMVNDPRYVLPPNQYKAKENSVPIKQAQDAAKLFMPIRDKIIAALWGNHERKLQYAGNIVEDIICKELGGVPYGTEVCRIILRTQDGKPLFNILAMHGRKVFTSNAKDFEQREANKKAMLKLYLQEQEGDCSIMLCGHAHKIIIVEPSPRLVLVDGEKGQKQRYLHGITGTGYIPSDQRWYACCGSARKSRLDGYDDYAQCFEPNELGFVKIIVEDREIVKLEPYHI